jgi:HEAT repeat protein
MRRAASAVVLTVLLGAPAAPAQTADAPASTADRVQALLLAYEHVPTAGEVQALGAEGRDLLIARALDPAEKTLLRARAVWALAFFPDDTTRRALESLLEQRDLPEAVLRRAIGALAGAFGEAALPRVARHLDDPRPDVREAAARAVGGIGGDEALRALRARAEIERSDVVKRTIVEEIRRIEAAGSAE